ncbi:MAG: acyltransferase [Planctomycetes bacterium]|nr:acyltransferase [Planctomycetota bacterium]
MRLGVLQYEPAFGQVDANLDRIDTLVAGARDGGPRGGLVVLPELAATGYQFASRSELAALAEAVPGGPTTRRLSGLARREGLALVAGLAEARDGRYYNSAVVLDARGETRAVYRKIHLYAEERTWFAPGEAAAPVVDLDGVRLGVMICFDWLFPETARSLALAGAEVIAHPANLVLPWCPTAMVTRALENGVYAATANRTGREARGGRAELVYRGESQVVGPRGEVLFRLGAREEALRLVEVDLERARDKTLPSGNAILADRRPAYYGPPGPAAAAGR